MVLANNLILTNNVEGNGVLFKGKLSFFFGFPIDFNYGGRGRAATGIKLSTRLAEGRDGKHRGTMKIGTRTSRRRRIRPFFSAFPRAMPPCSSNK